MPAIGDFAYGYDQGGLEAYLDDMESTALTQAKEAVDNISGIVSSCENEWEGRARENFVQNLKTDAEHVSAQFDALYGVLKAEVSSAQAAMANKDEELIQVG